MNRTKSLIFFAVVTTLQTAPSLTAQQHSFDAKVPFQFSAGDRTLPAGEYRIFRHDAFLHVENQNGHVAVVSLASSADAFSDGQVRLVFDCVSDQYFLRRVVAPASIGSIELAVTRAEKRATLDQRRLSTRIPAGGPTQIVIAGAQ